MEFKELETDRLILRRASLKDCNSFYNIMMNPKVFTFLEDRKPMSYESFCVYFTSNILSKPNLWVIESKFNNVAIGYLSLENLSIQHKTTKLYCEINPKYWCDNFCTEAMNKVIEFLKENNFHRLVIEFWYGNVMAQCVAKKLNFNIESVKKDARVKNNQYYDLYVYTKFVN